jgi:hypothetical protein
MRQSKPQSLSNASHARRLERLAAAFAAFRRGKEPGRWIPLGLRTQVVAALDAGVSASAIQRSCGVSWSQVTRWRLAAQAGDEVAAAPRVLSVVDRGAPASWSPDGGVELRVGAWRISVNRVSD